MNTLNPTIVRLSAQALLGRRRGLVLVLIPGSCWCWRSSSAR